MRFVSVVALIALVEYLVLALLTGRAPQTYKIEAPATTGHPIFERWYRVQQNTVEQLVIFLPALFLFAYNGSPRLAGWIGLLFIVGGIVYARSYLADPSSRTLGFTLGFVATVILLLGALLETI